MCHSYWQFICVGNLANYMKLSEIDSIYLSVPVNFIFIGFDGKGNHGKFPFKLSISHCSKLQLMFYLLSTAYQILLVVGTDTNIFYWKFAKK